MSDIQGLLAVSRSDQVICFGGDAVAFSASLIKGHRVAVCLNISEAESESLVRVVT